MIIPQTFSDFVGDISDIIAKAQLQDPPNFLLHGPPGCGKTMLCRVIARNLIPSEFFEMNYVEMNASDERNIDVVRKRIIPFLETSTYMSKKKVLFLDEIDNVGYDAQQALKAPFEKASKIYKHVIILATANRRHKIDPAIVSRFWERPVTPSYESVLSFVRKYRPDIPVDNNLKIISKKYANDLRKIQDHLDGKPIEEPKVFEVLKLLMAGNARSASTILKEDDISALYEIVEQNAGDAKWQVITPILAKYDFQFKFPIDRKLAMDAMCIELVEALKVKGK